ncbi:2-oxoglutarate dehydrogenase E1 component [Aeoliella sp. ICT_H6.2]|uniref:2-oxoglutarate dehydrogenase E1 component n=1 Tax=Aeoliella straminimaris TaxID=2954799 RepID=A0A9X2F745_9BACT|nr:2-oxoglutarate dehydrogenase E1 component [Aeoliella straminimaris]MCO6043455.1 2-oxoglutarate dehydrogenase E1 component [Aeoliella straminimaris]
MNSQSLNYIEQIYSDYLSNAENVSPEWRQFFQENGWRAATDNVAVNGSQNGSAEPPAATPPPPPANAPPRPQTAASPPPETAAEPLEAPPQPFQSKSPPRVGGEGRPARGDVQLVALQERVDQLIRNHRVRGHIIARLDPLKQPRPQPPELDPAYYGFTEADYDRVFSTRTSYGPQERTLREIVGWLRNTYCRFIGAQFMHIDDLSVRQWLQDRMESNENRIHLRRDEQLRILRKLTDAVIFEEFIQKKFLGAKSFSLEGAESLIPLLDMAVEDAGSDGVEEIVLAMAHRGRLNVLANVIGKDPRQIFREFEDVDSEQHIGRGDVKYHLGYSSNRRTANGRDVHLSLCFNPSHLEFVNTVAMGRMRAKQDRTGDRERRKGLTLTIHGDAAFAGEGVVQETLNMSELPAYTVGGTIHLIVNNQIGFTTTPQEGRSSVYCTDVAKLLQIPIFHVNGEHPEAVAQVLRLAMDFRYKFQRDIVIDMYCYRLRGHNEGDEPSFTQPLLYQAIEQRKSVRKGYLDHLLELGGVSRQEAEQIAEERQAHLERELASARSEHFVPQQDMLNKVWKGYRGGKESEAPDIDTGIDRTRLSQLLEAQTYVPEGFTVHPKIKRGMDRRLEMAHGSVPLDWAAAESLAFASLATQGYPVRLTGQDVERGTFSHRHAVLHDVKNGATFMPLNHLSEDQAVVEIFNSPLSEAGVLAFEYGYSLDSPDALVMWEAQFGDFANAAQVVIDQFIASAEDKWRRLSGLVLMLPHGFEGQGPEHSSARLERFLLLAAEDNMQVVYPTTPAQVFHLLRRQMLRHWRKPLVVMTPKSLLRQKDCVSSMDDLASGQFERVISDPKIPDLSKAERILLCTGKVYYELCQRREELELEKDVAILRVEQLYPLPTKALEKALATAPDGAQVIWVQEEPENMGAWRFLRCHYGDNLLGRLPMTCVTRPASASPATGSRSAHVWEQNKLIAEALGEE